MPQHVLDAVHIDADRDVSGFVADMPAIADLHEQRIQVDHRIERFERSMSPCEDLVSDLVYDLRDRLMAEVRADGALKMIGDVSDHHPPAWSETIMSSNCESRLEPVGTNLGVKDPSRSRGIANSTSPTLVPTLFAEDPLRELSKKRASESPFS